MVRARADLQDTIAAQADIEAALRGTAVRIAILLGEQPHVLIEELKSLPDMAPVAPKIPVGLPSELIARRADVRAAERQLAAWSFAGVVQWPIFNGGRLRAEIDAADARAEAARANFDSAVLSALGEVETALAVYVFAAKEVESLQAGRADRARALDLAEQRYSSGIDDLFSVLDAQRTLSSLDTRIAASEADLLIAAVDVYAALGGGWEDTVWGATGEPQ